MTPGEDFKFDTLQLEPDYEGPVTATLVIAKANQGGRKSILYLHGFIDYFFHPHLAEACLANGFDFYALELRKYGHSLLPHQHPNYCKSLNEYFEELDIAIDSISVNARGAGLVILGHSTGGLLASYYMNKGALKKKVSAMVLNSPFLELNEPSFKIQLVSFFAPIMAAIAPYSKIDNAISSVYVKSMHKDFSGEWDFNLAWKPVKGFPAYFAWLTAIIRAQHFLYDHSDIPVPVLLMHSHQSDKPKKITALALKADTVLNTAQITRRGPALGPHIDTCVIENGMHDLFLSPKPVRDSAMEQMFSWLKNKV